MPLFSNVLAGAAGQGGAAEYVIPKSLRFNSADTSYLKRTPSTAGSQTTWSWSCWLKLTGTGNHQLFGEDGGYPNSSAFFQSNGTIRFTAADASSAVFLNLITTQVFRDHSAWYHIICVLDTTNATAADRARIYVNGTRVTNFSTATYPSQNATTIFNAANNEMRIGTHSGVNYFDGLMADIQFVDGQALQASDFGEARSSDGVWVAKEFDGTYGTNGFHLNFSDSSTNEALGFDSAPTTPDPDPKKGFDVVTYTGNGGVQNIGGLNFEPGLIWLKSRSESARSHSLYDNVRGASKVLKSDNTDAEVTMTGVTSFNPDGFTLGSHVNSNNNNVTYVAWNWRAGGPAVSNSDGTITSQVSANTDYGFSIVTYSGTGTQATVGHGLGATPKFIILKRRDSTGRWAVYYDGMSTGDYIYLDLTDATTNDSAGWPALPTSSLFTISTNSNWNNSSGTYVAYCWSEVSGYSKFGSYTGDGTSTKKITTGFKPRFLLVKPTSSTGNWNIFDSERPANTQPITYSLQPNLGNAEYQSEPGITFNDDGFTLNSVNTNGVTYIYAAFADRPGNHWDVNNIVTNEGLAANKDNFDVVTYTGNGGTQSIGGPVYSSTSTVSSPTNVFNGDTSNGGVFNNAENRVLTAASITITSSLEIYHNRTGSDGITVNINGTDYVATGLGSNGYHTIPIPGSDLPLTTTGNITIKDNVSGAQSTVYAVRVDSNVLVDGTGVPLKFQPDFVWIKMRSSTANHSLFDSVRGAPIGSHSNLTNAEFNDSSTLTAFNSNGFSLAGHAVTNASNQHYVAWCWKAGGTAVSNTDGSITSSVSAGNGFSVVTWTGTGSAATIGHGLNGKVPKLIITKRRDSSGDWYSQHASLGATYRIQLNSTSAATSGTSLWNSTSPTGSVFSVGADNEVNASSGTFVAYCFADVPGYQRIGSYVGNGSTTGPVVVTGFKPRFLLIKNASLTGSNWFIFDSERSPSNPVKLNLKPNSSASEETDSSGTVNFNENGFQIKSAGTHPNGSGNTIIYLAIGDDEIGSDEDCLVDVPNAVTADADATDTTGGYQRGNYATLNPLAKGSILTLSNGNLDVTSSGNYGNSHSTIGVSSGKWYYEYTTASATVGVGITKVLSTGDAPGNYAGSYCFVTAGGNSYKQTNGSSSSYGSVPSSGDVIGVAFDLDNGTITTYLNGVSQGAMYSSNSDISSGATFFAEIGDPTSTGNIDGSVNFGQMRFKYPMPSGYAALNTTALPAATIEDGSAYFDTSLWTGNGGTQSITGLEFSPDLVWIKMRSAAAGHRLYDAVRGATKFLVPQGTDAEGTQSAGLTSFDSAGFSLGSNFDHNNNNSTFVGWTWDAGSSTVSNTDGSITSTVRANPSAGFSIVAYTGNGSSSATVGHGLNAQLGMLIHKRRDASASWKIKHTSLTTNHQLLFNTAASIDVTGNHGGGMADLSSSSTFGFAQGLTNVDNVNGNNVSYINYCFAPVAGYSAFGSYEGNGSSDGPFVYTGFRVKFLLFKNADSSQNWFIYDTSRDSENPNKEFLRPNLNNIEGTISDGIDILSNGFKLRQSSTSHNGSGNTIIYAAFAENPFQANGGLAR